MLNFLRIFLYPSISMSERHKLPKEPGIYYLRLGKKIEYIGQSTNLKYRWTNEGDWKHKQRIRIEQTGQYDLYRLHYRKVSKRKLDFVEYSEIELFNPPFNVKRIDPQKCINWRLKLELIALEVIWAIGIGLAVISVYWLLNR
jgi:excinuclease UvrABC nuclease subunit